MNRDEPSTRDADARAPAAAPEPEAREAPPRIRFSSAALEKVRELMEEEDLADGGLRVSAHFGGGCSLPLNFDLELDVEPDEGDHVLAGGGIRVFVAPRDAWAVDGLEVDYVESGAMGSGFAFRHPRGKSRRAC